MIDSTLLSDPLGPLDPLGLEPEEPFDPVATFCDGLFDSLPRSDQREKAVAYVRGLLCAPGRKSMRNIARGNRGPANEQSLHHFINDSTWDWRPVRAALARRSVRMSPPRALVVRPTVIEKAGARSVGVVESFHAESGRTVNTQRAFGVWSASPQACVPFGWRLHLPPEWLADDERRAGAGLPGTWKAECQEEGMIRAVRECRAAGGRRRPLVVDARRLTAERIAHRLVAERGPVFVRVGERRTTRRGDPFRAGGGLESIRLGGASLADPGELWLTNTAHVGLPTLVQARTLIDRTEASEAGIGCSVGLLDYAGRSFGGWHRHVTLASVAHALRQSTASRPG